MQGFYYAITVSPKQRIESPIELYRQDEEYIMKLLNKFSRRYALYPEFDDKQRLHYHGLVLVHDRIKLNHTKYLFDKLGWTLFDRIRSNKQKVACAVYATKDWAENRGKFLRPIQYRRMRRLRKQVRRKRNKDLENGILQYLRKQGMKI